MRRQRGKGNLASATPLSPKPLTSSRQPNSPEWASLPYSRPAHRLEKSGLITISNRQYYAVEEES